MSNAGQTIPELVEGRGYSVESSPAIFWLWLACFVGSLVLAGLVAP